MRALPELAALSWWLIGDDVALVDGDRQRIGVLETDGWMLDGRDTDVVLGPDGWLDGLLGGWARVQVVDGALQWSPLDAPPPATEGQISAMRTGFERAAHDDFTRGFDAVPMPDGLRFAAGEGPIHETLLADPAAFRNDPIPPVGDLDAAAGLVERNGLIAVEGFDWGALDEWRSRNRFALAYGLDPDQADVLAAVLAELDAPPVDGGVTATSAGTNTIPSVSSVNDGSRCSNRSRSSRPTGRSQGAPNRDRITPSVNASPPSAAITDSRNITSSGRTTPR